MSQDQYETYQRSRMTHAEETAERLADKATKLLEASMLPTHPQHKHKWATGQEKWEALQREGRKAASGKRGRPVKQSAAEKLVDLLTLLTAYQADPLKPWLTRVAAVGMWSKLEEDELWTPELEALARFILDKPNGSRAE